LGKKQSNCVGQKTVEISGLDVKIKGTHTHDRNLGGNIGLVTQGKQYFPGAQVTRTRKPAAAAVVSIDSRMGANMHVTVATNPVVAAKICARTYHAERNLFRVPLERTCWQMTSKQSRDILLEFQPHPIGLPWGGYRRLFTDRVHWRGNLFQS